MQRSNTPEDRGTRETPTLLLLSSIVPWTVHSSSSPSHSYTLSTSEVTLVTQFPANSNNEKSSNVIIILLLTKQVNHVVETDGLYIADSSG